MPFTQEQKDRIEDQVGKLCRARSRQLPSRPRCIYRIRGSDVVILQSTPGLVRNHKPVEIPVAKIRYNPEKSEWTLLCVKGPGKWWDYPKMLVPATLETAVREIAEDGWGIFWGTPEAQG